LSLLSRIENQIEKQILKICKVVDSDLSQVNTQDKLKLAIRFEKKKAESADESEVAVNLKALQSNKYIYYLTSGTNRNLDHEEQVKGFTDRIRKNILLEEYFKIPLMDAEPDAAETKSRKKTKKMNQQTKENEEAKDPAEPEEGDTKQLMTAEEYNARLYKKVDIKYLEDANHQERVINDIFESVKKLQNENEAKQKEEIEKPWYEFFNEERPYDEIVNFIN